MKNEEHLPILGVGPFIIIPIILISILSLVFSYYEIIPLYQIKELNILFFLLGIILVIMGIILWLLAVVNSRISQQIINNNLVTSGVYSYVRHPIYSAFLFISTGLILISQNIALFFLPIIYWLALTIAMIKTEERWLLKKYGDEYVQYSKKVNRFIPFFN
ncbi:methyltransferase family protein [Methanobrevibacter olleyae]|uniref:Protein-S-isoprenylcysteine O-methyltransferase Ste14 n=1 Tax=Methanobrevibacter olleyae TaxID=294671 RepID=A0A126QZ17_METOL|nr:isoprenylcysteine carboxylmethyltransferase family protein [Methanobrevibacter olleyae]AMK15088.1 hypothetical protein YLM1_0531 [Methanobrevibacter olleyae]SFL76478.1 Protein-S-isoprenylcysteine O-methyltransferase Ste14 [Methanobrevibacter olleyae]